MRALSLYAGITILNRGCAICAFQLSRLLRTTSQSTFRRGVIAVMIRHLFDARLLVSVSKFSHISPTAGTVILIKARTKLTASLLNSTTCRTSSTLNSHCPLHRPLKTSAATRPPALRNRPDIRLATRPRRTGPLLGRPGSMSGSSEARLPCSAFCSGEWHGSR
jgi:hypothetical protein